MALFDDHERRIAAAVAALIDCSPFVPERVEIEKVILGGDFLPIGTGWFADGDAGVFDPNLPRLRERVESLAATAQERLRRGISATPEEGESYRGLVLYLFWLRYEDRWLELIKINEDGKPLPGKIACFDTFAHDVAPFAAVLPDWQPDLAHLFACGFQIRRAFYNIFRKIFGASPPAARLRAAVWRSIFTNKPARFRRTFYDLPSDPTLITGAPGTGKELVARAIARSRYIPFDPDTRSFVADPRTYHAVNVAAVTPTLFEAEMFGHRKGAFTGADAEHVGWFERCGRYSAIFFDEIGELDIALQAKLLRVLQAREFHRVGETEARQFVGKLILATNRDLESEVQAGGFRDDLYARIVGDVIVTPTLREQLAADPDDLRHLVRIVARRMVGPVESEGVANDALHWIQTHLPPDYEWPGNMRDLEQCVRAVKNHGEFRPRRRPCVAPAHQLAHILENGGESAEGVVLRYAQLQLQVTGDVHETARRLDMDVRTVRKLLGPKPCNGKTD